MVKRIDSFQLQSGDVVNAKFEILKLLGAGEEGEVYLVREISTDIERAAKFFFPRKNIKSKASKLYAKKLHKLKHCEMVIQYFTQESFFYNGQLVDVLISEFIDGELLSSFLESQPAKRLHPFMALHLLHALAKGVDQIHRAGQYHGDLHIDNLMVQRFGLDFELKLIDVSYRGREKRHHRQEDVIDMIEVFYEVLGGKKHYAKLPKEIKDIICGLKHSLILKKFNSAGKLKNYIENMQWES